MLRILYDLMVEGNTYTRKLQPMGNSNTVTLPKKWIKLYNLKDKDLVTIKMESDGSLKITPSVLLSERHESEELHIEFYNEVGKEVLEKCLSGIKRIIILSDKPINKDNLVQIRYFVGKLPNAQITIEKPQEIIINNLGVKDLPSDEILRGIFLRTLNMFENVRDKDNYELTHNLKELRMSYMRIIQYTRTYLTTGFLHQKDYKDFNAKKASDYREISNILRDIAYLLDDLDFFEEGYEYYKDIQKFFRETYDAYLFKNDPKRAYGLYFKNLWDKGRRFKANTKGEARYMIKDLFKIFNKCSDILSIISILE